MIDKIYIMLNFGKYNIYIWSSFLITFLLLFIQLLISIIIHNKTKQNLRNIYNYLLESLASN